jgi:hypothetical protein
MARRRAPLGWAVWSSCVGGLLLSVEGFLPAVHSAGASSPAAAREAGPTVVSLNIFGGEKAADPRTLVRR